MKCILKVTKDCRTCASQWDQGRGRETGETGCQNWGTLPRKPVAAVTEHRDVQREVQKPQKIKKDVRYVMRGTWREKKAPCIIQRKWQLWDDSESGTGEMLGVRIQFPQNHPLSAFYHSPTMSREKSHCCNSVKQMLWNCTLTVQTYTGAKKKMATEIFLSVGRTGSPHFNTFLLCQYWFLQGGQAHGYYFCIPTVSTKRNATSIAYHTQTHTQTRSSMQ